MAQQPLLEYRLFFELMLAGFVISLLRSKIGLITYGVFGPIVISYLLLDSGIFWGLVLFVNLFIIGLSTYVIIEPFKLGTPHRIGALVMTVGIGVTFYHIMAGRGVLPADLDSLGVFFPAIITGWYADRFARDLSERGWRSPAIRFVSTLVTITIAYAIISNRAFVEWFVHTPEAWVVLIGLNVVSGTSSTVRLKEYIRFNHIFARNPLVVVVSAIETKLQNLKAIIATALGYPGRKRSYTEVLGMNRRNKYIKEYNPPHLNPIINKASMKRTFHGTGVPTPETYTIVDEPGQLDTAAEIIRSRDEFVIKPDSGYGGEGIIVVTGRTDDGTRFETSNGEMAPAELRSHLRSILEGQYTRMGLEGIGIIEELVHPDDSLQGISGQGVPDIRVIVFQGFPIMSMTRLPTEESNGAANLHLGAVGVGLATADGSAMGGYQSTNRWFDTHPDTGADLTEFVVPE